MAGFPAVLSRVGSAARGFLRAPVAKANEITSYSMPMGGGWIPSSWGWNWWQQGKDPLAYGSSAVVQACVEAYAQTLAMCPADHWRKNDRGGRERVPTAKSALARIMRKPNSYQSPSDFMLNLVTWWYTEGNAYALALRNDRGEIAEYHLMDPRISMPRIATTGDVFYSLAGNPVVQYMFASQGLDHSLLNRVPARDVLHIRMNCKRHMLIGEPPLTSALLDVAASNAMVRQALAYAANEGRPSGVLETDLAMSKEQVQELRQRWNDQTQGMNAGGTPILTSGLKWNSAVTTPRDSQLAELLQIADTRVAMIYRVPLSLLGIRAGGGGGGGASGGGGGARGGGGAESLMRFWIASGLGFAANHIEMAIGQQFRLAGGKDEYMELDMTALQRSDFYDRIMALAAGVHGGIFAPNEARAQEELPPVPFGDEPRVQQQDVPLSFWGQAPPKPPAPPAEPAPTPPPPSASAAYAQPPRDWARDIIAAADRYDRLDDAA